MVRIGVIAGVFDPIHTGHVNFINKIINVKNLDQVLILIEKAPRFKKVFASFENRKKMVSIAIKHIPKLKIYDNLAESFPISACMPKIKANHPDAKIFLLIGKDVAEHIITWKDSASVLKDVEIVVADRADGIRSGKIRSAIKDGKKPGELDAEVYGYIKTQQLYT